MAFPTTLSNFVTGASSGYVGVVGHAADHNALEAKVGIDGSAVTSSLDYKINHLLVANITDITASAAEINKLAGLATTKVELGYVSGVTSAIQTQINLKAPLASPTFTGTVVVPTPFTLGAVSMTATGTELNYVAGATSSLQTQITALPTASSTTTFTNKRVTKRAPAVTQAAAPAINTDITDVAHITGLAQAITSMTTNLTGTPVEGDTLRIDITDNGTARAITWGAKFESSGQVTLPTTTVLGVRLDTGFVWNSVTSAWRCVAVA